MSGYVYIRSEDGLYTVGVRDCAGKWRPESDRWSEERAAAYVEWLNSDRALSAAAPELVEALREAEAALNGIRCTCRCTPWGQVGPAMIRARAALAAATGERT